MSTFGEQLKAARMRACMTEPQLAAELQVTRGVVAGWCQGRSHPSPALMPRLLQFFPELRRPGTEVVAEITESLPTANMKEAYHLERVHQEALEAWRFECLAARKKHKKQPPPPELPEALHDTREEEDVAEAYLQPTPVRRKRGRPPGSKNKPNTPALVEYVRGPFEQALFDGLMEGISQGLQGWADMKPFANLA